MFLKLRLHENDNTNMCHNNNVDKRNNYAMSTIVSTYL